MASSRTYAWIAGVFLLFLGVYAAISILVPSGQALNTFGNIAQCLVPLIANAGLLRYISKGAVTIILIEMPGRRLFASEPVKP